jgi:hypothetical protein
MEEGCVCELLPESVIITQDGPQQDFPALSPNVAGQALERLITAGLVGTYRLNTQGEFVGDAALWTADEAIWTAPAIARRADAELDALWTLYRDGIVREKYSPGGPGIVLVLEVTTMEDARLGLADFPLVEAGVSSISRSSSCTLSERSACYSPMRSASDHRLGAADGMRPSRCLTPRPRCSPVAFCLGTKLRTNSSPAEAATASSATVIRSQQAVPLTLTVSPSARRVSVTGHGISAISIGGPSQSRRSPENLGLHWGARQCPASFQPPAGRHVRPSAVRREH